MDIVKKAIYTGLGVLALTEEKISEAIDELAKKGEISEKDGKSVIKQVMEKVEENKKSIEDEIEKVFKTLLDKSPLCSRDDIEKLEKRIKKLEKELSGKSEDAEKKEKV